MEQSCPGACGYESAGGGAETLTFWSGRGCPSGMADFRPRFSGGAPLAFSVSTRILLPPSAGGALSDRNVAISEDWKRRIRVSCRLRTRGFDESRRVTNFCLMGSPEINPRMSGDPSALVEKLSIDAALRALLRMLQDSKSYNWDITLLSQSCMSNVKNHVLDLGFKSSLAAGMAVGG